MKFEGLDQTYNISKQMATGLEVQRYRSLDTHDARGRQQGASLFWPMLSDLPGGVLLAFSDLSSEDELRALFPNCTVSEKELRKHPCEKLAHV